MINKGKVSFFVVLVFLAGLIIWNQKTWAQKTYVVKRGDTLGSIAERLCKSPNKWSHIYRTNRALIQDENLILPGWKLIIPCIPGMEPIQAPDSGRSEETFIKLVTGNGYAPFTDESAYKRGMITEIVEKVFEKAGYKTETEFWNSWERGRQATKELEFDATFPYVETDDRKESFHFSRSLHKILTRWYVRKDSSVKYDKPEDLKGLVCCKSKGYNLSDIQSLLDNNIITLRKPIPEKLEDCFKLLKNGEVNLVPINEFVGDSTIMKLFGTTEDFQMLDKAVSIDNLHLMISKIHPDALILQYKFNQALKKLEEDGTHQKIIKEHLRQIHGLPEQGETLRLVTGNGYAPFTDESLPNKGMITEIVERAFERAGYKTKFVFSGWKKGYDETVKGKFDATFPYVMEHQRMKEYHYSRPLYSILTRWYVKKDSPVKYDKPGDLKGLVCCKAEGYNLSDIQSFLDNNIITLLKPRPAKLEDCFKLLKRGEVDLVPIDELVGSDTIRKTFGTTQDFRMLDEAVAIDNLHFIVPKTRRNARALLRKFDQAVDDLEKDGTLRAIIKRHLRKHHSSSN